MKRTYTTIAMALLLALTAASCKKDNSNNTVTPSGPGTTTTYPATMAASNYGFDGLAGSAFSSTAAGIVQTATTFSITGIKDGTKESINIILLGVRDTGTYDLDKGNAAGHGAVITKDYTLPADVSLNYRTDGTEAVTNNIGGGKVHITTLTATDAAGTFYIIAYNGAGKAAFAEQGTFSGKINKQ